MSNYNQLKIKYDGGSQTAITLSSSIINPYEYQARDIVSVEVPEIVQTISEYAFCDNNSLANIVLNEGLQRIEGQAFQHGVYTAVTIPSTVTYIGFNSFNTRDEQDIDQHTFTITCLATTPPTLDDPERITFGDPSKITAIYVPSGSVSDYQNDWPQYASKIQAGAPPAAEPATTKNILKAFVGSDVVEKMYLGSELVWEPTSPVPVYSAMPLTFRVLSAGTIVFGKYVSTAYTANTCVFKPMLNGVNIGEYQPAIGFNGWVTYDTTPYVVNVQPGDIFEIYGAREDSPFPFQSLGKGNNQNGVNTSYHSFSGSTAVMEVYGNIMSVCLNREVMSQYQITTWKSAYDLGGTGDLRYVVTSLFRGMPGLVSAENLWLPEDAPSYCYINLFKGSNLQVAPKVLPASGVNVWCYGSMFEGCTALTESPIIKAETLASTSSTSNYNYHFYAMFKGCSNLNKITCFMNQTNMTSAQRNSYFSSWVSGVASGGNFYKKNGTGWYSGTNGYPQGWTMNVYQE